MAYYNKDEEWRAAFALLEKDAPRARADLAERIIASSVSVPQRRRLSFFAGAATLIKNAMAEPLGYAPAAALALGMAFGFFVVNDARFNEEPITYSGVVGDAAYVIDAMNDEALL
ncbi:MAG: hypothetical protein ABW189_02430 [Rickettsiales bacterium]